MKYVLVALSLLLIGSIADVPVMFLALSGSLSLPFVLVAGFLADVIPDFFWYWLGMKVSIERFAKWKLFRQKPEHLEAVGRALDKYGSFILFGSKFVYWFGIPTQIMAGAHRYPLKKAAAANALGSAGWLALLYGLAHIFTSTSAVEESLSDARIDFTIFTLVAIAIYYLFSRIYERIVDPKEGL